MASPGQLVQVMADALGISRAAVTQYDRVLAENGLRTKAGRGRSAAQVTSTDAANLLIAIAGAPPSGLPAKDAVRICKNFSSLSHIEGNWQATNLSKLGLTKLARLPDAHSFGSALSALIGSVRKGELYEMPADEIWVNFVGPKSSAEIVIRSDELNLELRFLYRNVRKPGGLFDGNLFLRSTVGIVTIHALGQLVLGSD
jgi:hypothetical protein